MIHHRMPYGLMFVMTTIILESCTFAKNNVEKEITSNIERQVVLANSDAGTTIVDIDLGVLALGSNNLTTLEQKTDWGIPSSFAALL